MPKDTNDDEAKKAKASTDMLNSTSPTQVDSDMLEGGKQQHSANQDSNHEAHAAVEMMSSTSPVDAMEQLAGEEATSSSSVSSASSPEEKSRAARDEINLRIALSVIADSARGQLKANIAEASDPINVLDGEDTGSCSEQEKVPSQSLLDVSSKADTLIPSIQSSSASGSVMHASRAVNEDVDDEFEMEIRAMPEDESSKKKRLVQMTMRETKEQVRELVTEALESLHPTSHSTADGRSTEDETTKVPEDEELELEQAKQQASSPAQTQIASAMKQERSTTEEEAELERRTIQASPAGTDDGKMTMPPNPTEYLMPSDEEIELGSAKSEPAPKEYEGVPPTNQERLSMEEEVEVDRQEVLERRSQAMSMADGKIELKHEPRQQQAKMSQALKVDRSAVKGERGSVDEEVEMNPPMSSSSSTSSAPGAEASLGAMAAKPVSADDDQARPGNSHPEGASIETIARNRDMRWPESSDAKESTSEAEGSGKISAIAGNKDMQASAGPKQSLEEGESSGKVSFSTISKNKDMRWPEASESAMDAALEKGKGDEDISSSSDNKRDVWWPELARAYNIDIGNAKDGDSHAQTSSSPSFIDIAKNKDTRWPESTLTMLETKAQEEDEQTKPSMSIFDSAKVVINYAASSMLGTGARHAQTDGSSTSVGPEGNIEVIAAENMMHETHVCQGLDHEALQGVWEGTEKQLVQQTQHHPQQSTMLGKAENAIASAGDVVKQATEDVNETVKSTLKGGLEAARQGVHAVAESIIPSAVASVADDVKLKARNGAQKLEATMDVLMHGAAVNVPAPGAVHRPGTSLSEALDIAPEQQRTRSSHHSTDQLFSPPSVPAPLQFVSDVASTMAEMQSNIAMNGGAMPVAASGDVPAIVASELEQVGVHSVMPGVEHASSSNPIKTAMGYTSSAAEVAKDALVSAASQTSEALSSAGSMATEAPKRAAVAMGYAAERASDLSTNPALKQVMEPAKDATNQAGHQLGAMKDASLDAVADAGHAAMAASKGVASNAMEAVESVGERAREMATSIAESAQEMGRQSQNVALAASKGVASNAMEAMESVGEKAKTLATSVAESAQEMGRQSQHVIKDAQGTAIDSAKSAMSLPKEAAKMAMHGIDYSTKAAMAESAAVASSTIKGVESVGETVRDDAFKAARTMADAAQTTSESLRHMGEAAKDKAGRAVDAVMDPIRSAAMMTSRSPTDAVRGALRDGVGSEAVEQHRAAMLSEGEEPGIAREILEDSIDSFILTPLSRDQGQIAQQSQQQQMDGSWDYGDGGGSNVKKVFEDSGDSLRQVPLGDESAATDGHVQHARTMDDHDQMGVLGAMKKHIRATVGIWAEQLPYEFAKELQKSATKEELDEIARSAMRDDSGTGHGTGVGKALVDSVVQAQRRLGRTVGGANDYSGMRRSSMNPASESQQNIASAPTSSSPISHPSSSSDMNIHPMLTNRMKTDAVPHSDAEGRLDMEEEGSPFEELMETKRRMAPKPSSTSSYGDHLSTSEHAFDSYEQRGIEMIMEEEEELRIRPKQQQGGVAPTRMGIMSSLKGRARLLLGLQDPTEGTDDEENDFQGQGNEVGGLAKEVILGSKDALGPNKGSKSKREMQDLVEHAIAMRKQLSMPMMTKRENPAGDGYVQGHETGNNFPMEAVERKKTALDKDKSNHRKGLGWLMRGWYSKSKL